MSNQPPNDNQAGFDLAQLEYELPEELIAQQPSPKREDARLLVINRTTGQLLDRFIPDLPQCLRPGDLLVLNNTKVLPARFNARRMTGGAFSGLFIDRAKEGCWEVMLTGSRRLRADETVKIEGRTEETIPMKLIESLGDGRWLVRVDAPGQPEEILDRVGEVPLPPYIHRGQHGSASPDDDRRRYQTIYAQVPGAIAAPTAGLHLTDALLDRIRGRGIEVAFVTLHVGVGTFKPISADRIADHVMHTERFELLDETADAIRRCRDRSGRVVAVGTTVIRVLESTAASDDTGFVIPGRGDTNIFIYPPHRFRVVDALLTNFHLPKSTLLALIMAFAGVELTEAAYAHAIKNHYRFYSYGDATFME